MFPGGQRRPVRKADNLTTFMCRLSWSLGASPSWNPQGLSGPVIGLLYLFYVLLDVYVTCWMDGLRRTAMQQRMQRCLHAGRQDLFCAPLTRMDAVCTWVRKCRKTPKCVGHKMRLLSVHNLCSKRLSHRQMVLNLCLAGDPFVKFRNSTNPCIRKCQFFKQSF